MSRQWGHWRLGRGGWRVLHWSSISRAFTPHFLAHRLHGRAQQHQHRADRKNRHDHFNLQPRPRTHSVCFHPPSPSLARPVHFHRYSLLSLVPLAVVPRYHPGFCRYPLSKALRRPSLAGVCRSGRISKQVSIIHLGAVQQSPALPPPLRHRDLPPAANSICAATSALASRSPPASDSAPPAKKSSSVKTVPKAASVFTAANASIEVSFLYYLGQPSVFVRARVARVEELPRLNLFRYGVSYA